MVFVYYFDLKIYEVFTQKVPSFILSKRRVYKLHKNIFINFKSKKIRWETLNHKSCLFDVICTFKLDFVWQLKVNVLSFCWLFWLWIYCIWSIITHNFVLCYYSYRGVYRIYLSRGQKKLIWFPYSPCLCTPLIHSYCWFAYSWFLKTVCTKCTLYCTLLHILDCVNYNVKLSYYYIF